MAMTNKILLTFLLVFAFAVPSFAEVQVITLKDGSTIKGELVGISNGVYTITTPLMGYVQIDRAQVVNISAAGADAPPADNAASTENATSSPQINKSEFNQKSQVVQNQLM